MYIQPAQTWNCPLLLPALAFITPWLALESRLSSLSPNLPSCIATTFPSMLHRIHTRFSICIPQLPTILRGSLSRLLSLNPCHCH